MEKSSFIRNILTGINISLTKKLPCIGGNCDIKLDMFSEYVLPFPKREGSSFLMVKQH